MDRLKKGAMIAYRWLLVVAVIVMIVAVCWKVVMPVCLEYRDFQQWKFEKQFDLVPYTVQSGEALWSIAQERVDPALGPDVRERIQWLVDHGGASVELQPGQVILIPVKKCR